MISIVIPAYNEENSIEKTILSAKVIIESSGNNSSEIIIVDDGSTDNTGLIAKNLGAIVLRHPHNIGYGRSLKDGINAARNDTIIITDSDGTYTIGEIPLLLSEYAKGFDMVVGARQGKNYHQSFFKYIFRVILKFLVEYTAGRKVPDINSGMRIFSKKSILPYFSRLCDTFSFTTSLTLAYMMTGKFVCYIPIEYNKRIGKTKVKLLRDSLRTLQYITEAIIYYNPLKIFLLISILLIIGSLISFIFALLFKYLIFYVIGISFFISTIFVFCFGLVSVQIKNRTK